MSRRKRRPASPQPQSSSDADSITGGLDRLVTLLTSAVIFCRLLTPTEGAVQGETLWIGQLALLALIVWVMVAFRADRVRWRLDWIDGAVSLLGLGPAIAALVNYSQADKRAVVNLLWEWVGLMATWFLVRRLLVRRGARQTLLTVFLTLMVALAGVGLWQHYVSLPESRRVVAELQAEWDELQKQGRPGDPRAALAWEEATRRLQIQFVQMRIPTDESSRMLWNQRLQASSEPLGPFALANTFAGLLLVAQMLWLGALVSFPRTGRWTSQQTLILANLAIVTLTLVLTKSRTAYVGSLLGVAVTLIGQRSMAGEPAKAWRRWGVALAGLAGIVALAGATGGIDRLVAAESFKSLRYRGEYWQGTWRMMTDSSIRWFTGVGPGNFRQYYLEHKLPGSSEEIADPHNLILDLWTSGGLVSLIGLAGLMLIIARPLIRPANGQRKLAGDPSIATSTAAHQSTASSPPHQPLHDESAPWSPIRDPVVWGAGLSLGLTWLLDGTLGMTIWILVFGLLGLSVAGRWFGVWRISERSLSVAGLALLIHLLGAGGISMPAVTQTLLLLVGCVAVADHPAGWSRELKQRWPGLACLAAAAALWIGCWWTATTPVMNARDALAAGDEALFERGEPERARGAYRRGVEADPLAVEACERLSQYFLQRWLASRETESEDFDQCLNWQQIAISRQPRNFRLNRGMGTAWLVRFGRSEDPSDAQRAADHLAAAAELYPSHAELQSELAEAWWNAEQHSAARLAADWALELDRLNRRLGHIDKQLSAERLELMESISAHSIDQTGKRGT
ncbi:MAG: O-antigen ligase family protein [Planctomycetales bacterium]